ncbi:NAD(+)/NADH kinase [Marinobacterium sp. D7]|uniref:diacylglycerol/lipid kinase family protein n=1 Tax=Marinobacterium ramblicola TaxID=2849041 RepID=UPI001C2D1F6E|nr:diacylglycerol kinase family protein [Marinobacterium ramblicola]MBV1787985.1 NAD(+)/NADH kinase [Marinobacterium ramblicola]
MSGKGTVHILANGHSGQGQAERVAGKALAYCRAQGVPARLHLGRHKRELHACIKEACQSAGRDQGRVLVVGGDGTIRAVSEALCGTDTPMAVVPTGTFNFFSRNLNIPLDTDAAIKLALEGTPRRVNLGRVNQRIFNNNASFGLYARMIRAREQHTRRFGRHRMVAILSTLLTLMRRYRSMSLTLSTGDRERTLQSPMVFVGINSFQLRGVDLDFDHQRDALNLGVVVMKPVSGWALFRLSLRGLMRRLRDENSLEHFYTDRLEIRADRRRITVVLDGERLRIETPLRFSIETGALWVVAPDEGRA